MPGRTMIASFMLLAAFCAQGSAESSGKDKDLANGVKYAVAYCLSKTYTGSEFASDALYVSGSYIQTGRNGLPVYEAIREYVDAYLKTGYSSKHDRNLDIMQCLDLYDERDLERVITGSAGQAAP